MNCRGDDRSDGRNSIFMGARIHIKTHFTIRFAYLASVLLVRQHCPLPPTRKPAWVSEAGEVGVVCVH